MKRGFEKAQNKKGAGINPFISEQTRVLCKLLGKTGIKPTANRVHDLRVAVRRLRVALWLATRERKTARFRALSKSLRNLGKILGELRQLDVAIGDAKAYRLPVSDLKARRKKARKEVGRALTPKLGDFLEKEIKRLVRLSNKRGGISARNGATELLERAGSLRGRGLGGKGDFHRFRIFIKKVRYTIEAIGYRPGRVKTLHDILGKARDLEVLQQLFGENELVTRDKERYLMRAAKIAGPVLRFARARLAGASSG